MTDELMRHRIDDDLDRGYSEKPILKEEQRKILEKLLDVSDKCLSPDERALMDKLVSRLESDSQRIKDIRRHLEGRGSLSELISLLQSKEPPRSGVLTEPAPSLESKGPDDLQPPPPFTQPAVSAAGKTTKKTPAPPKAETRKKPEPLSSEPVIRSRPAAKLSGKPRPWKEVTEARKEAKEPKPPEDKPVALPPATPPSPMPQKVTPASVASPKELKPATSPPSPSPASPPLGPAEVVRRYIMAWNHKAFAAEYDCFSPSLIKMSKENYVDRRMAIYLAYNSKGNFTQEMGTVLKTRIDGDNAEILCVRAAREFHKLNHYLDLYVLQLEDGHWRISGVTTQIVSHSRPSHPA